MKNIISILISFLLGITLTIVIVFSMDKGEAELVVDKGNNNIIHPGTINVFSGTTAPEGYLFCDGRAVSRTTYSKLFSIIGTKYGAGDGSTTFNLPNLNGRVPVGKEEDTNLGDKGGAKTTTLTLENLPSHSHTISSLSGTTSEDGSHNHTLTPSGTVGSTFTGSSVNTGNPSKTLTGTIWDIPSTTTHLNSSGIITTNAYSSNNVFRVDSSVLTKVGTVDGFKIDATHTHSVTAAGTVSSTFTGTSTTSSENGEHSHTVTTDASTSGTTGSGTAFTNMSPYMVVNYIIKY